jgi:hypothetical protein
LSPTSEQRREKASLTTGVTRYFARQVALCFDVSGSGDNVAASEKTQPRTLVRRSAPSAWLGVTGVTLA